MNDTVALDNAISKISIHDKILLDPENVKKELGDGPGRFFPVGERSLKEQIESLTDKEKECFDKLKAYSKKKEYGFSDEMILRFARCSPGAEKFKYEESKKVMKKFDTRYLNLRAANPTMEKQLLSKTLFPVPGLKCSQGFDVFYMKPNRYFPKKTSTGEIIDNLAYCMNTMVEKEKACKDGIAFMANMDDWKMTNFSVSYCSQFMMMLQGRVPVRVRLFLIVNPPSWFDVVWKIMKPMLAADFRKKVHVIPSTELSEHLMKDYLEYLPDDMEGGKLSTEDICKDFVAYRKFVEK
mmetsp:Transcript_21262/g.32706  ORF Transcript_21262/g.32706 Transcript_21262/m.32706 type:complete len:295 (-) Transcript_21262:117-1001(-)